MNFLRIILFSIICLNCSGQLLVDDGEILKKIDERLEALSDSFPPKGSLYKTFTEKIDFTDGDEPRDIKALNKYSLILVRAYKCRLCPKWHKSVAAAFAIRQDGLLVTNYHAVDPKNRGDKFLIMDSEGNSYPVTEIFLISEENDVALVKCTAKKLPVLGLSDNNDVGSGVRLVSHPDGRFYTFSKGYVSRHFKGTSKGKKVHQMSISAAFAKGSSGAPVVNQEGKIVGMVSFTRSIYHSHEKGRQINLQMVERVCIPSQVIRKVLKP